MIIYTAENILNGNKYVGRTIRPLSYRKAEHIRYSKNEDLKYPFYMALRKYGIENFRWSVLESCSTEEELIEREDHYIKKFGYYNVGVATDGGDNITNNPREIDWNSAKRSESLKAYCDTEAGRRQRAESAKKTMTDKKKKIMLDNLRKKLSDKNFREDLIRRQRISGAYSEEILARRGNTRSKMWIITDPTGHTYNIKNLNKFCKERGLSVSGMHMVSTGIRKHYKSWKCKEDLLVLEGGKQ